MSRVFFYVSMYCVGCKAVLSMGRKFNCIFHLPTRFIIYTHCGLPIPHVPLASYPCCHTEPDVFCHFILLVQMLRTPTVVFVYDTGMLLQYRHVCVICALLFELFMQWFTLM